MAIYFGNVCLSCSSQVLLCSPVVFLVHQVVAGAEGHQVGIVGWGGDGHGAGAAYVGVTQLVGEQLELIRGEAVVIPQDMVMGGSACALLPIKSNVSHHSK